MKRLVGLVLVALFCVSVVSCKGGGNVELELVEAFETQLKAIEKDHVRCMDKLNIEGEDRKDVTTAYEAAFRNLGKMKDQAKKGD